ncbi:CGNR zinc finger domain-containing protein [Streptomyces sp. NPDC048282]|uniref:CGNR zinc finger domain-containing protein n=1 Tax=Streptomyces sp. NPDC048282 TaxID=3365528 RepID=UPI003714E36E
MAVVDREHQDTLLDLLNSTPVIEGVATDELADPAAATAWQRAHGGSGGGEELRQLLRARDALQDVVRGGRPAESLAPLLKGVVLSPRPSEAGVSWELEAPAERRLAAEAVLAWGALRETMPGRLRPCANPECRLFLLDRSKGNSARWCSMAVCGNRMKARRHYQRTRDAEAG